MKLLVEVEDQKLHFLLEVLNNFQFVKTQVYSPQKTQLFDEIKEAVAFVQQIKKGKAKPIQQLLNELQHS